MKHQSKLAAGLSKKLISALAMVCLLIAPAIGFSQGPPPPGPGNGGGNPDSPLGVPFDTNMTLAFIAVAIVFAVLYLKKVQKAKLLTQL